MMRLYDEWKKRRDKGGSYPKIYTRLDRGLPRRRDLPGTHHLVRNEVAMCISPQISSGLQWLVRIRPCDLFTATGLCANRDHLARAGRGLGHGSQVRHARSTHRERVGKQAKWQGNRGPSTRHSAPPESCHSGPRLTRCSPRGRGRSRMVATGANGRAHNGKSAPLFAGNERQERSG